MTHPADRPARAANLDAARLLLARLDLSPEDLLAAPPAKPALPPSPPTLPWCRRRWPAGTRRVYGSYWNRIVDQWGQRRLAEPTPSDVRHLVEHVKASVVARRNARGGRSAAEHLIAALRCVYRHAEGDGLIDPVDNPARRVAKPRRLPSPVRPWPTSCLW